MSSGKTNFNLDASSAKKKRVDRFSPLKGPAEIKRGAARQARVLNIFVLLQNGRPFTTKEISDTLLISRRTVYRDLKMLRETGVNIKFDHQRNAYHLQPIDKSAINLSLTADEVELLTLAARFSPLFQFADYKERLSGAIAKSTEMLPNARRRKAKLMLSQCSMKSIPEELPSQIVEIILKAIYRSRQVRILLSQSQQQTLFSPYYITHNEGKWLATGRSSFHKEVRAFDFREINRAEITNEPYELPKGIRKRAKPTLDSAKSRVSL